jgi:hypothetical protein
VRQQPKEYGYIEFMELLLKRIDSIQNVLPCDVMNDFKEQRGSFILTEDYYDI